MADSEGWVSGAWGGAWQKGRSVAESPKASQCLSRDLVTVTFGQSAFQAGQWAASKQRGDRAVRMWGGKIMPRAGTLGILGMEQGSWVAGVL